MSASAERIYLDNAATSWPKPPQVLEAITGFYEKTGSAAGRGQSAQVSDSNRILTEARSAIASLIHVSEPNRIVFAFNATDALNTAIHGFVRENDHVVTSEIEHNSVLRPLRFLADRYKVQVDHVESNSVQQIDTEKLAEAITGKTRLVCLSAVSNVTGVIQPIPEIGKLCRERNVPLLVDASQAVGHIDVDVRSWNCDLLACAGHKGLMGPLGTGFLYVGPRVEDELIATRQGGTGSNSEEESQPSQLPDRLESGNLNIGGIAGMLAGIRYVNETGLEQLARQNGHLASTLREGLARISAVTLFPSPEALTASGGEQSEIVSFQLENVDPQTVESILDTTFGIQVRSGLHCAPRMHRAMGTIESGGTIRVSPGCYNTIDEIQKLIDAIEQITKSF